MSEIAREARTLAEQQVEDASEISSIAKQAYDISSEAYNMARDAMEQQHFTAQKVYLIIFARVRVSYCVGEMRRSLFRPDSSS